MRIKRVFATLLFCACFVVPMARAAGRPIRVAILDGASGGAYHNWRLTTPVLKKELEETGLFDVTVITAPASDGDFSNFKPDFARYQAIVMNYDAPTWPDDLRAARAA